MADAAAPARVAREPDFERGDGGSRAREPSTKQKSNFDTQGRVESKGATNRAAQRLHCLRLHIRDTPQARQSPLTINFPTVPTCEDAGAASSLFTPG